MDRRPPQLNDSGTLSSSPEWTPTSTPSSRPRSVPPQTSPTNALHHPHVHPIKPRRPLSRKSTLEDAVLSVSSHRKYTTTGAEREEDESELDWSDKPSSAAGALGLEQMGRRQPSLKGKERAWSDIKPSQREEQKQQPKEFSSDTEDEVRDQVGGGRLPLSKRRPKATAVTSVFSTSEETLVNPSPSLPTYHRAHPTNSGTHSPVKRSSTRLQSSSRPHSPQSPHPPPLAPRSTSQRSTKNRSSPRVHPQIHPDPPLLPFNTALPSLPSGSTAHFVPRRRGRCNSISIPYPISVDHSLDPSVSAATVHDSPQPPSRLPHFSLDTKFSLPSSSEPIDFDSLLGSIESLGPSLKRSLGEAMLREENKAKAKESSRVKKEGGGSTGRISSSSRSVLPSDSTGDEEVASPWKGGRKVSLGMGLFKETSGDVKDKEGERKEKDRVREIDKAREGIGLGSAVVFENDEEEKVAEEEELSAKGKKREGHSPETREATLERRKSGRSHPIGSSSRTLKTPTSPSGNHSPRRHPIFFHQHNQTARRPTLSHGLSTDEILDIHGVSSFQLSPPSSHNRPSVLVDLQSSSVNLIPSSSSFIASPSDHQIRYSPFVSPNPHVDSNPFVPPLPSLSLPSAALDSPRLDPQPLPPTAATSTSHHPASALSDSLEDGLEGELEDDDEDGDWTDSDESSLYSSSDDSDAFSPTSYGTAHPSPQPRRSQKKGRGGSAGEGEGLLEEGESEEYDDGESDEEESHLPTVPLMPFKNQVGGHSAIYKFTKRAVCKVRCLPLLCLFPC
jgi:hypothetical protein